MYIYIYVYIYDGNEARLLISYSNLSHPTQDQRLYPDDKDTTGCLPGPRSRDYPPGINHGNGKSSIYRFEALHQWLMMVNDG